MPKSKKPRRSHSKQGSHSHQWTHPDRRGVMRCTSCPEAITAADQNRRAFDPDRVIATAINASVTHARFDYLIR